MRRLTLLALALALTAVAAGCSGSGTPMATDGGSGSVTTNGFAAAIVYPNATPAAHAVVRVRPADYLADTNSAVAKTLILREDILTDEKGRFRIDSLDAGEYMIEALDANGNAVAITCAAVDDSIVSLGTRTLVPLGTIAGTIGGPFVQGFARIRGLERCVRADSVGWFETRVPAGQTYRVNVTTADTAADFSASRPVQPSQVVSIAADLGNYRSDSLAIRAFLDNSGLGAIPVDSVVADTGSRRIRNLDLSGRGLTAIPPSVSDLSFIWGLDFSNNPITDLPSTLDRIPLLAALNISHTPVTSLPPVVTRCVHLQWLFLSSTGIRALPPETTRLTILHELWLNGDSLDAVPAAVFELRSLHSLGLARNRLTQLPAAIGNLDSLEYLYLNDNQLDSLPNSISSLARLKVIYAFRNNLVALPDSVGRLRGLVRLEAQENRIAEIPASIGQCANLRFIHLFDNLLTTLPASIVNLTPTDGLRLGWNRLCTLSSQLSAWADTYAEKTWLSDQTCP